MGAGTSRSLGNQPPRLPSGLPDAMPEPIEDGGIDGLGDGLGDVDDLSDSDVADMLDASVPEAEDEDGAPGAAASSNSALVVPPAPELIVGPSPLGYYRNTALGKGVFRVTGPFGNSMSIKCYLHPNCSLAVTKWKLPSPEKLKEWSLGVRARAVGDTKEVLAALTKEYLDQLRALRDAATQ